VLTCLQVTQGKVRLLQAQSQLLNDELIDLKNKQSVMHFELVLVQNNPLFDDDNDDYDQQSVQEKQSEPTSYTSADEDEVVHEQVQFSLYKTIIRPWEEIKKNKNRKGIGYDKEETFHTPYY
jgi:hypothetical protein